MEIKKITQDDLWACAIEMADAFKVEPWNENWSVEQAYERFDEIMSSKNAVGYCMYDEGKVICCVCGRILPYLDFKEFYIEDFSVLSSYQGQGIGTKMFAYIRNDLKNIKNITLITKKGYPSVEFYQKNGLEIDESSVFMVGKGSN